MATTGKESTGGPDLFLADGLFDDAANLGLLGFIFAFGLFHSLSLAAREVFESDGRRSGSHKYRTKCAGPQISSRLLFSVDGQWTTFPSTTSQGMALLMAARSSAA
jgi:hypothetical protein